jgi:hypothetical protein
VGDCTLLPPGNAPMSEGPLAASLVEIEGRPSEPEESRCEACWPSFERLQLSGTVRTKISCGLAWSVD